MTAATERTAPATRPGDPAEYDIAAALAEAAADLADAVDDNRPDWLTLAVRATSLLDCENLIAGMLDKRDQWGRVLPLGDAQFEWEDVRRLLNAGADKVSFNSAAVANPQVILADVNGDRRPDVIVANTEKCPFTS